MVRSYGPCMLRAYYLLSSVLEYGCIHILVLVSQNSPKSRSIKFSIHLFVKIDTRRLGFVYNYTMADSSHTSNLI
jgi:hypothetical protein